MLKMKKSFEYLKRNFFNTAIADIYRALDGKSHIGGFTLTFCLIDCLTWLEYGHTKNQKEHFIKWVDKRLQPLYPLYQYHAEELYSVRCALVHTYGPSKGMVDKKYEGYELNFQFVGMHLVRINNNILKICLYSLLTDTVYAAHIFFEDISQQNNSEVINRLETQIKTLGIEPPLLFAQMHTGLSIFDKEETITLDFIRAEYTQKILYP